MDYLTVKQVSEKWNTVTQNFEYTNLGQLPSLSSLSALLLEQFADKE